MAPLKVRPISRRRVLQVAFAGGLLVTCIVWFTTALPGSLQPREGPLGVVNAVSNDGAEGETGASLIEVGGDPIPTETVTQGDPGPDFVSLEEIQKHRTESFEAITKDTNLVFKKDGIISDDKLAGNYHRATNQESETTPIHNTAHAVDLTTSIKLVKDGIGDFDSQADIMDKKARTFDGTPTIEDLVFMEDAEYPNEFFKDVDPGIQLRFDREEPDNGIQRKDGSPKPVQEMLGGAYSVTEEVAHEVIGHPVPPLDDLQMEGSAVAGVRVVFTRPEAEKDGDFYVDPRGNVFRKASRMSHDACQQLLLMEDARHTGEVDCSYDYNHPAHTRHGRSPPVPLATQQNAPPADSLAKALRPPSVGAPSAAEPETASETGGGDSNPSLPGRFF